MTVERSRAAVNEGRASTQSGAHILLAALESRGVTVLFGVPGHGAYPIYDAINDFPGMRTIVGRHEQGITFAAIGYAWSSGRVAVATSVPAAGLTNASTALLEATMSQDRLIFLLESDATHSDILRSVARYHRRGDECSEVQSAVNELLDRLEFGRPGAAVLEVPNAVLNTKIDTDAADATTAAMDRPSVPDRIGEAAKFLASSTRVVVLAGATAVAACAERDLRRLAEQLGAPVMTDGFAKGALPEAHPLSLGHSWTPGGPGERLLTEADAVLVVGAPVAAAQNTAVWDPAMVVGGRSAQRLAAQLVLVDWDDQVLAKTPARYRLYGDVPAIITALAEAVSDRVTSPYSVDTLDEIRDLPKRYAEQRIPWALPAVEGIADALPDDGIVLADSLIGVWLDRLLPAQASRIFRFPWGTGTLGFGIPAAVGAKIANPEREVVVIAGDGAFLYNPQELATMRMYGLKVTVIVANDNCYGAIKHNMTENFGRSTAHSLSNPDFIQLGQAFGMNTIRLNEPAELGDALASALAGSKSTLIEVPLELKPPAALYSFAVGYV